MRFTTVRHRSPSRRHPLRELRMSLVFALVLCGTAVGQQIQVSGTVTSLEGDPLVGVSVRVEGSDVSTNTDVSGRFFVMAPPYGVLLFSSLGYRSVSLNIANRTALNLTMQPAIAVLDAVVVTGYTEQRRADITGAVGSVDVPSASRQTTVSVLKRLAGRVPGVTVDASGSPGSRSTVRIRGIGSFQNNDPLYIIDGTPVESSDLNFLNPNDIESIQVLKDASSASIYGSRASNGVVIIQTLRGSKGAPRFTLDVKMGVSNPVHGYDDFLILDALEYHEILKRAYENAGLPVPQNIYGDPDNPTIPAYIRPNDGIHQTTDTLDRSTYSWPDNPITEGSPGTNWWDAVFSPALVTDANLAVSGGGTDHRYSASFNYLDHEGTGAYNRYQRGSVRINTEFDVGRLTIGENLSASLSQSLGGFQDATGFVGLVRSMQPVLPVYDVRDNFAASRAAGLPDARNPLKWQWGDKDDAIQETRGFGNVFAGLYLTDQLQFMSRLGFNLGRQSWTDWEDGDPELFASGSHWSENYWTSRDWTWSNTLTYSYSLGERHNVRVLLGQEASRNTSRYLNARIDNLITTDLNARYIQDVIGDPETKQVASSGSKRALLSYFGKIDYDFAERYHLNVTLRRDGSSAFSEENRWGTFPAFGLGWRLSEEPFLEGSQFFTNIMLRFGWGITGNQDIPTGRILSQFGGGVEDTYYDIGGTSNTVVPGFRQTVLGNSNLKWEENRSMNVGLDIEFFGGNANVTVDVYQRDTDNLLFDPLIPAAAGQAAPPIVNIGQMRNRGIDFSIGYGGTIGTGNWRLTFNGSHYKNEIRRIDGVQDYFFGEQIFNKWGLKSINQVGGPVGSFYGLICDGIFLDQADVDAHAAQDGKAVGRLKFRDLNGDGAVNDDDWTIIGDAHPDFTAGLDLEVNWGAWDFSATVFGTFGNQILDVNKEFYVFRYAASNVRRDLLTDAAVLENGLVTNPDAKYPRLDQNDYYSNQPSTFFVDDGSYVRLQNLQIGYRLPQSLMTGMRVYLQAENLFTITGYPGLDPALPVANVSGPAGDVRDQYRGWDMGAYPSNRTFSLGINATFW
jgi:TonB-linked SusC/RagA family outer membrane protein